MAALTEDDAVASVRAAVGAADDVPGRAWTVRRLDRAGETYYLVVLGGDGASIAVGAVSPATGDIGSSAHLAGRGPHLEVDAARARTLAGAHEAARAELVWRPSPVSRSPLYPVWEVEIPSGLAYVDQAGSVGQDPP